MSKGNNYPAHEAAAQLDKALAFVPNLGPDMLTTATLTPERLGLADKAAEVAAAAPDVMRRTFDPSALPPSWPTTAS